MYRLTLSDNHVEAYRQKQKQHTQQHMQQQLWQRIYRWENKWGTYTPGARWEDHWRAEIRTQIASDGDTQLFERVIPIADAAPPAVIDDVWEDQVFCHKHITCGNLLSITGTLFEIQEYICKLNIVLAPSICESIEAETQNSPPLLPQAAQAAQTAQPQAAQQQQPQQSVRTHGPSQRPERS